MTKQEGLALLKNAPRDDLPSAINPLITRRKFVETMMAVCSDSRGGDILDYLFERRVWQAVKNQKRPRYKATSPKKKLERFSVAVAGGRRSV